MVLNMKIYMILYLLKWPLMCKRASSNFANLIFLANQTFFIFNLFSKFTFFSIEPFLPINHFTKWTIFSPIVPYFQLNLFPFFPPISLILQCHLFRQLIFFLRFNFFQYSPIQLLAK